MDDNKRPFSYYDHGDDNASRAPWQNDPVFNKDGDRTISEWFGDKRHYRPWFDPDADYNTNAKSYYDYLAYRVKQLDYMINAINDLLRRDIDVKDTDTVKLSKEGDWQKHEDILTLYADVKISQETLNALIKKPDGLFVKDLQPEIDELNRRLDQLNNRIDQLNSRVKAVEDKLNALALTVAGFGEALEKLRSDIQSQLAQMQDTINGIYALINGSNYTKIPDTDFYYNWYNGGQDVPDGWGKVSAKILQTPNFSTLVISFPWANPSFSSMKFNGGHVPLSSTPESYVGGFGFKNKYASLNDMQVTNIQFSSDAPHVEPVEKRASWTIGYNLDTSKTLHAEPFQVTMASFADGYNSPTTLQDHYSGIYLKGAPLTITLTLKGSTDGGGSATLPDTPPIPEGDGILCTPTNPNGVTGLTRTITRNIDFYDEDGNHSGGNTTDVKEENKLVSRTISFQGEQPITDKGVLG